MAIFDIGYAEQHLFDSLPSEKHVVDFEGQNDSTHPQNWSAKEKLAISMILLIYSLTAMSASAASWIAFEKLDEDSFPIGAVITVLGSACGIILCTRISDLYGRRIAMISATFGFGVSSIAVASSVNPQTVAIARYFVVLFGCAPLTLVPAVIADMCGGYLRSFNVACYTMVVILSSFIGHYLAESPLRWDKFALLSGVVAFSIFTLAMMFKKESHSPIVLIFKAAELRRQTYDWRIHVKQARYGRDPETLPSQHIYLLFQMLFYEPLIMLVTITMSLMSSILHLITKANFCAMAGATTSSKSALFLHCSALVIGACLAVAVVTFMEVYHTNRDHANNKILMPEWRMPSLIFGTILFASGLLYMSSKDRTLSVRLSGPIISSMLIGFGIHIVFMQCLNYILEVYGNCTSFALAASAIIYSSVGYVFRLLAARVGPDIIIETRIGLLGYATLLTIPASLVIYVCGKGMRAKSGRASYLAT